MDQPLVSVLTIFECRRLFADLLACFEQQDYANRELIVYVPDPLPLKCSRPRVTLIMGQYDEIERYNAALLASARGLRVVFWDSRKLYLPWAVSRAMDHLTPSPALIDGEFAFPDRIMAIPPTCEVLRAGAPWRDDVRGDGEAESSDVAPVWRSAVLAAEAKYGVGSADSLHAAFERCGVAI